MGREKVETWITDNSSEEFDCKRKQGNKTVPWAVTWGKGKDFWLYILFVDENVSTEREEMMKRERRCWRIKGLE